MAHPSAFDSEQSEPQLQLVVHAGPLAGKGFPIAGETLTFGRDTENDITLDDSQVSRRHARLIKEGGQLIVEDLGSTNGTLVNGKPISERHLLQPADIISIGSSVFGVKGFSAPQTMGVTQVSPKKLTYSEPVPSPRSQPPAPARSWESPPGPAEAEPAKAASSGLSMFAIVGILALIFVIVIVAGLTAFFLTRDRGAAVANGPEVIITSPVDGSQVALAVPLTVQATASDPAGVVRMELWVSGAKTAESTSPIAEGQPTFTASFQWTPETPGSYRLEVRAYNSRGAVSAPQVITVNTVGEASSLTGTPTDTPTPEPPTATVPGVPSLTTQTDLNVRSGPGLEYDLLGLLPTGTTAEIIGRSQDGQWWQIRFDPALDNVGWVAADPAFATTTNTGDVPIIPAPPTPTSIPTATPTPTPTSTPAPPTLTPTPTPTPTPTETPSPTTEPTGIQFNVSPTSIEGGECVTITWMVTGVKEIYFQGQGVSGSGNLVDCPEESVTYRLRVVKLDNSEQIEEIKVEVINPIVSGGTITVDPDESVDFDNGNTPGDDFGWEFDDGVRRFEAKSGVQLAVMRDISSLDSLSLGECAGAPFGNFDFIDGSDVSLNEGNRLIPGRSACYRTNQGRLGKLRFPEASTGSLKVEWLTWK